MVRRISGKVLFNFLMALRSAEYPLAASRRPMIMSLICFGKEGLRGGAKREVSTPGVDKT